MGSLIPEKLFHQYISHNVAGDKFQSQIIRVIRETFAITPDVFSVQPVAVFPKSRVVFVPSISKELTGGIRSQSIPFVNILFLKQLTIGLSILFYLLRWLWRKRKNSRFVFVYNVYPPMALPVLLSTWLLGGKAVCVVPDFPHNLSFEYLGWKGFLQRFDVLLEARSLAHFDGIISATRYVAEDFAPYRPMLVMEGGVDSYADVDNAQETKVTSYGTRELICLFSGTLYDINGIDLMLEAFSLLPNQNYRLWIFGQGPLEQKIRAAALRDKRIVYWGFLPNREVFSYQHKATVLLNARPTNQLITRYTFPSKLREYMLSGRPVISTELPGIPDEYYDFIYVFRGKTPKELKDLIIEVCSKPPKELNEFGRRAREFVLRHKNWKVQGKRIYDFINSL